MSAKLNLTPTFLKTVNIFRDLREEDLRILGSHFETREFPADSIVLREGETSEELYVLRAGTARVVRGKAGEEVSIGALNPGDYFGEAALFQNVKRTASIQAVEHVTLLAISKQRFEEFLEAHPLAAKRILHQMLRQLFFRLQKTSAQLEIERQSSLATNALNSFLS